MDLAQHNTHVPYTQVANYVTDCATRLHDKGRSDACWPAHSQKCCLQNGWLPFCKQHFWEWPGPLEACDLEETMWSGPFIICQFPYSGPNPITASHILSYDIQDTIPINHRLIDSSSLSHSTLQLTSKIQWVSEWVNKFNCLSGGSGQPGPKSRSHTYFRPNINHKKSQLDVHLSLYNKIIFQLISNTATYPKNRW